MPGPISLRYLLICTVALGLPLLLATRPAVPGWAVNVSMILALLGTSRLFFASKVARVFWYVCLSMNGVGLVLAGITFFSH